MRATNSLFPAYGTMKFNFACAKVGNSMFFGFPKNRSFPEKYMIPTVCLIFIMRKIVGTIALREYTNKFMTLKKRRKLVIAPIRLVMCMRGLYAW